MTRETNFQDEKEININDALLLVLHEIIEKTQESKILIYYASCEKIIKIVYYTKDVLNKNDVL